MGELLSLQITIYLLVAVGFGLKRSHIIGPQGQKNITDMVIYVILPCNIAKAFISETTQGMLSSYLGIFLISLLIQMLCVVYGKVVFRREPEGKQRCLKYGTICSNAGFLGNPIAEGVYGAEGLVLASFYLIPQRIMMWSSGLAIFSGTKDFKKTLVRVVTHPCIIACVLGIFLMLTGLELPAPLTGTVTALGNCNTAMSMMVIGMILGEIDLKKFWDWSVFGFTVHRLVIIPAIIYMIIRCFIPVSDTVLGVSVLLAAMPAGATTSILAEKYGMEPEFATKMVIFSTLVSLPTTYIWGMILPH